MREVYTLADLRDWPAATADAPSPVRLAVVGDPVAHSASPPMHNAALAACGIDAAYTRLHVAAHELDGALRLLASAGFIGVNLTIPHKTAARSLLDQVDAHAASLGAVNTVRVDQAGRLEGFNTDGPGFEQAVQAEFGVGLRTLRVMVLGAGGGAGRALAAQCALIGCPRLVLVNRTPEKARALAVELQANGTNRSEISTLVWEKMSLPDALRDVDLVVNASSVGLRPGGNVPRVGEAIPAPRLRFGTVYRAAGAPTPLVAAACEVGARSAGGLSMLLYQGALAFEHWFARPAPVDVMRRALTSKAATVRS